MADLLGSLAELHVHPVKSAAGVLVPESVLMDTGLDLDRAWMVVDRHGDMLTQREHPRLALVQPRIGGADVALRAPGMLALHVSIDAVETPTRVRVWDDEVQAWDMGALAGQWFSDFLGEPGLRLVRFEPEQRRLSDRAWTGEIEAENAFSDGFPLLVVSTASLAELNARLQRAGNAPVGVERFRPNLVIEGWGEPHDEDHVDTLEIDAPEGPVVLRLVKPCVRCSIPDVDPATGEAGGAVLTTMAAYRASARMKGGLTFGMNAVIVSGQGHTLRRGARVQATLSA